MQKSNINYYKKCSTPAIFLLHYVNGIKSPSQQGLRQSQIFFVFCPINKCSLVQKFENEKTKTAYKTVSFVRSFLVKTS